MNKPTSFCVNGMPYTVSYQDLLRENRHGDCQTGFLLLRISNIDDSRRQAKTLLHELLHAALYESGVLSNPDQIQEQENLVLTITPILFDLLKANDFAWVRTPEVFDVKPKPKKKKWWRFW